MGPKSTRVPLWDPESIHQMYLSASWELLKDWVTNLHWREVLFKQKIGDHSPWEPSDLNVIEQQGRICFNVFTKHGKRGLLLNEFDGFHSITSRNSPHNFYCKAFEVEKRVGLFSIWCTIKYLMTHAWPRCDVCKSLTLYYYCTSKHSSANPGRSLWNCYHCRRNILRAKNHQSVYVSV